jgi:hypothetical protein
MSDCGRPPVSLRSGSPFSGAWLSDRLHAAHMKMQARVRPIMQERWSEHRAGRLPGQDLLGRRAIVRVVMQYVGQPADPETGRPVFPAISKLWDVHVIAHPNGRVWCATVGDEGISPVRSDFELLDSDGSLANWDLQCFYEAVTFVDDLRKTGAVNDAFIESVLSFHLDPEAIAIHDGRVECPRNQQLTLSRFVPAGLSVAPLPQFSN